jgi:hypothetical protein
LFVGAIKGISHQLTKAFCGRLNAIVMQNILKTWPFSCGYLLLVQCYGERKTLQSLVLTMQLPLLQTITA